MTPCPAIPPRESAQRILVTAQALLEEPVVQVVLDALGGFVLVLNEARQILAMNPEALLAMGIHDSEPMLGLRPGDALGCASALRSPDGCHTGPNCPSCGAYLALMQADRNDVATVGECFLLREKAHRLEKAEFRVKATPIRLGRQRVFILVLQDISDQRAKASLERLFYHDLQNTVQALQGWCELLQQPTARVERVGQQLLQLTERLNREISCQRMMAHAEMGTLQVRPEVVSAAGLLLELEAYFEGHAVSQGRSLRMAPTSVLSLCVDSALLMRVLVNMVKNALEAIEPGETVDVRLEVEQGRPVFRVTNPGQLAPEVAAGLFQRTFSTKGTRGRGYGTYSMKLLGEAYLGGEVGFVQDSENRRIEFYIRLHESVNRLAI